MPYLQPFDPWGSELCSCPPKWSLNPYTGCGHRCLYCYATSFISRFYEPRIKKDFLKKIERELKAIPEDTLISLSNSSDPYQPLEGKWKFTRRFLEMLLDKKIRLLIITKSDLLLRDLDLLSRLKVVISLTITSKKISSIIEPGAPSFERRLYALKELKKKGFKTVVRLDPVIPGINEDEIKEVLSEVLSYTDHFVLSTYKAKPDSFKRLSEAFPDKRDLFKELYLIKGTLIKGSRYLPSDLRKKLLRPLIEEIKKAGKTFAFCREVLEGYPSKKGFCDGSFLLDS